MCITNAKLAAYDDGDYCIISFNIDKGQGDWLRILRCEICGALSIRNIMSTDIAIRNWDTNKVIRCGDCK